MNTKNDKKKGKSYWLIFLLCVVLGSLMFVTVSYTVGSTVLKIVGFNTTQVVSWDIRINNISTNTVGRAKFKEGEVSNTMIKDYSVNFSVPGDTFTMTFDIVNKGTLNARLDHFSMGKLNCTYKDGRDASDYCKNIYYVVEYANGNNIQVGDTLDAGQNRKVKVTLKYYEDALPLWNDIVNIEDLDISFIFGQK